MPIASSAWLLGCSTNTLAAGAHMHAATFATPHQNRPSRSLWVMQEVSDKEENMHGGLK